jgi:cell division protein FtsN
MTPSGVHVNKTAIAVIIGILILIVIGFKYKGGAIKVVSFDEKGNKGVDLKKEKERGEILKRKEEEKLKIKEEFKKKEEELIKQNEEKLKKKEEELKKKDREELKKKEEELKKKEGEGLKKKEEEGLKKKEEEIKKKEEQNQAAMNRQEKKSTDKTESMAATIPDWKSVTWMETKIPDEIISSAAKMRVEEKMYNVMVSHVTF